MADLKISQEVLISIGGALVICAGAFASIGAKANDNKEENKIQAALIRANAKDVNDMKVARAETVTRQTIIMSSLGDQQKGIEELKRMVGNLERAPEPEE